EAIAGAATIDLSQLSTTHLGIRANMPQGYQASVIFSVDGGADVVENASSNFTLGAADWNPTVGAHTITAKTAIVSDTGTTADTPLTLSLQVITDLPAPIADPNAPQVAITALESSIA